MRLGAVLLWLLLDWVALVAQPAKIDSLRRVIETTRIDTTRGRSLCWLGVELRKAGQMAESFEAGTRGLDICRKHGDRKGEAMCLNNLGNGHFFLGEYDKALSCYQQSLPIRKEVGDLEGESSTRSNIGNLYYQQGRFVEALEHYYQAVALSQQAGNRESESRTRSNIGLVHLHRGEYAEALQQFLATLQLTEKLGRPDRVAACLKNIGGVYEKQGQDDLALEYFKRSLAMFEVAGHPSGIASVLNNIGMLEARKGDYDAALAQLQASLALYMKLGNRASAANCLSNIGSIHMNRGQLESALSFFRRSYLMGQALGDRPRMAIDQAKLSTLHLLLGATDSAHWYAQQALTLAQAVDNLEYKREAAKALYQADSARGKWEAAFAAHQLFLRYVDSTRSNEQARALGRLEAQFEAEKELTKRDLKISRLDADRLRKDVILKEQRTKFIQDSLANAQQQALLEARSLRLSQQIAERDRQRERDSLANLAIFERLERERIAKEAELESQQFLLISAAVGLLLLLAIAYILYRSRLKELQANADLRLLNEHISQQKAEIEAQNSEIIAQRDQLNSTNDRLVELDRMKEQLTGMIVHDLKNPLNAVLAMAALPPEASRLNVIRGAGQQMSQLVLNLLDIQKYEEAAFVLKPAPQPAAALIVQAVDQTDFLAVQKQIGFELKADPRLTVEADGELIVRVLVNLLTNAIKYAPTGDRIEIEAVAHQERGAVFRVTDHGRGIPPDQLERIFDKFSQVDGGQASGKLRSTGLGLTFCRLTVEAHGGQIGVESEVGRYTIFSFNLPNVWLMEENANISTVKQLEPEPATLSAAYRAAHTDALKRLQALPLYSISEVLDVLDNLPEAEAGVASWKAALESAALSGNEAAYRNLLA